LSGESDVLSPASVSLQAVLRSARNETAALAEERGHTVTMDVPDPPIDLRADPERLRQVFTQLLTNAFTFTPEGGTVTVEAGEEDGEGWVVVRDTGIGLPEGELDRIFDDFYQVEDALTRSHGGLGLGLTIARKLVELQGGQIWAESPGPGEGTSLHVRLPVDPSTASAGPHG
jgi:signal transduction histidine kinase